MKYAEESLETGNFNYGEIRQAEASAAVEKRIRLNYTVIAYMCLIHLLAIAAFVLPFKLFYIPLAIFTYFFIGFCTTIGLHRLLSHRSFQCPKWVEYFLVTGAMLTGQGSPLLWVANHRVHHRHSDREMDVHSPVRGFWYSHFGWILDDNSTDPLDYKKVCKDLANDRYYHWLVPYRLVPQAIVIILIGLTIGWSAIPFVFFLPVVCWMHSTYSVNSFCHHRRFGTKDFDTPDESRNVWWVGLIALGEGWHNNHHAQPGSVKHGFGRKQFDSSYLVIEVMSRLGLAWDLKPPNPQSLSRKKLQKYDLKETFTEINKNSGEQSAKRTFYGL